MAKVVGLVGSASGKLGNVVYAVSSGTQIARVYQPVVSNPKSSAQMRQRAKGNLVGRISSFVPRTALMGLGVNNRRRRAEFLRILLNAATVTSVEGRWQAKVDGDDVVFSRGSVSTVFLNPGFSAVANVLTVTLSGSSAVPAEIYASSLGRIVAMIYEGTSNKLVEVVTKLAVKPEQGATAATILPINFPGDYTAEIYLIPMSTVGGTAASVTTDTAGLDDGAISALLSVNENAVVFEYGRSVVMGSASFKA